MNSRRLITIGTIDRSDGEGLSQEELADRASVHQTYLSGVEGGKRNPSIGVLARIAAALGVDIEELFLTRRSR
jgi:transcriptional regulator with XRE-family HTH domain